MKNEYRLEKESIKKMYEDVMEECLDSMEEESVDDMDFKIIIGKQIINIPINADTIEEVFGAIRECEKIINSELLV